MKIVWFEEAWEDYVYLYVLSCSLPAFSKPTNYLIGRNDTAFLDLLVPQCENFKQGQRFFCLFITIVIEEHRLGFSILRDDERFPIFHE